MASVGISYTTRSVNFAGTGVELVKITTLTHQFPINYSTIVNFGGTDYTVQFVQHGSDVSNPYCRVHDATEIKFFLQDVSANTRNIVMCMDSDLFQIFELAVADMEADPNSDKDPSLGA